MFRYNTYVVKFPDDFQIDSFESVADFVKNSGIWQNFTLF